MKGTNTVVSIFDHHARSVAGMEAFARELSLQLGRIGWQSVLAFASAPSDEVSKFLDLPNTQLRSVNNCGRFALRPMQQVFALLRAHRPEIVHLHFVAAKSGYPWLAKLLGVRGVYMHDHISRLCRLCTVRCPYAAPRDGCVNRAPRWKRTVNWLFCLPVTKMFCVSSFIHDCDVDYGAMPPDRLATLYNGVDMARADIGALTGADFRRRHAIPADRVLVVQAGALRQEKGVPDFLHAAQAVLRETNGAAPCHFLLAGDGPQRQEYERLAAQLGISDHVTFAGRVRDPLGDGLWAACDIACQVSRWQEAFGLTIAEAMAAGKPLVATRTGAIPELVADGRSGFLVEPGDTQGMADKILLLARDGALRQALGFAGKQICNEKFNLQKNVAALIAHYGIGKPGSERAGQQ